MQFQLLQPSLAPHCSLSEAVSFTSAVTVFSPQVPVCLDYTSNPSPMSVWGIQVPANVLLLSPSPFLFLSDGLKQTLLFLLLYYNSIFHNVRVIAVAFKWLMSLRIRAPWALKQYSASEGVWKGEGLKKYGREWERHSALLAGSRWNWRMQKAPRGLTWSPCCQRHFNSHIVVRHNTHPHTFFVFLYTCERTKITCRFIQKQFRLHTVCSTTHHPWNYHSIGKTNRKTKQPRQK